MSQSGERGGEPARALDALLVGAGAVLLYVATMAPTVLWGDDAELQRIAVTGEPRVIGQSSGASHMLWLAAASRFVPATAWLPLDPAGRTTLLSTLFASAAVPWVYAAGAELGHLALASGARRAGLAAAVAFGLSHTFWLLAVRPDVYGLQTALLAAALWCVLRWRRPAGSAAYLGGAALAVAAALLNHVMVLFSLPGLGALALALPRGERSRLYRAAAVAAVLAVVALAGAGLAGVPLLELTTTLASARPQLPGIRDLAIVPFFLLYQFPLSLLLVPIGARRLWRRDAPVAIAVALLYVCNVAGVLLVTVRDRFLFFLPSYLPVALLIGAGAAVLLEERVVSVGLVATWMRSLARPVPLVALLLAPLAVYPLAALAGGAAAARLAPARQLPGRDPVVFYLWPGKSGYWGARGYGEGALAVMEPGAAIMADWLPYQTLRYFQTVEGRRPDVLLANENAGRGEQLRFLLEHQGQRPLYLADNSPPPYYDLAAISRCFTIQPQGVVYRLTPRPEALCG